MSRYDDVAARLTSGAYELFTCDVFETLVWRPVARPTDLFVELGRRLTTAGLLATPIDAVEFSGARQTAEDDARGELERATGSPEVTLEEIWEAMPAAIVGDTPIERLVEAELACEADLLRAHEQAAALLAVAAEAGLAVVLVSNSYLSPVQLQRLVANAGVDLAPVDEVVTSSARRRGKAEGLIDEVIAERGVDPSRVLHFGDNELADLAAASRAGATGVLAELAQPERAVAARFRALTDFADRSGTDGAVSAAVRDTLLRAADPTSAGYQFGAGVVGPALAGFSSWASAQTAELGAASVHCLLREGAVIAELMQITSPHGPEPRLVHASRWAMVRASVFTGSAAEILATVERRTRFEPRHLAEAFALDLSEVTRVVGERPYDHRHRSQAIDAIVADDVLRQQVIEASAAMRRNVQRYFERALDLDHGPLVLCDIGWGGKIQACIDAIVRDAGFDGDVVGLYLMLSETGVRRTRAGAAMRSYLPATTGSAAVGVTADFVQHHAAILERVATPQLGTLLDFDAGGHPICRPADHDVQQPSLLAARDGVYEVTARLAAMTALDASPWTELEFRRALLDAIADTLAWPTTALAADLSTWTHDDLAGDDAEQLVAGEIPALAAYINPFDAADIGWEQIFWLPGLAALTNPPLAAQLGAVRLGVSAEALAAVSETGHARVATFPVGSSMASHQTEGVPRRSAGGWCLLRLHTAVPSSRGLRLDPGTEACLVQVARLSIALTTSEGVRDLSIDDLTDKRLHWIDGRPLGSRLAAFQAGGQLLIDFPEIGGDVIRVDVDWAFRTLPLDDDTVDLARPPLTDRTARTARQAARKLAGTVGPVVRRRAGSD